MRETCNTKGNKKGAKETREAQRGEGRNGRQRVSTCAWASDQWLFAFGSRARGGHEGGAKQLGRNSFTIDNERDGAGKQIDINGHRSRRRKKASTRLMRTSVSVDSWVCSYRSCPRASFTREKERSGEWLSTKRGGAVYARQSGRYDFLCACPFGRRASRRGATCWREAESKEQATMDQPSWMQNTGQAAAPGGAAGGAAPQQSAASQSGDA